MFVRFVSTDQVDTTPPAVVHPSISIPASVTLSDLQGLDPSWRQYRVAPFPPLGVYETLTHGGYADIDGVYAEEQWTVVPKTPTEDDLKRLQTDFTQHVQSYLDKTAQLRGWDTIYTAAIRAGYSGPYQTEGVAFGEWMDACWITAHSLLAEVQNGERSIPTPEEVIGLLPSPPTFSEL